MNTVAELEQNLTGSEDFSERQRLLKQIWNCSQERDQEEEQEQKQQEPQLAKSA